MYADRVHSAIVRSFQLRQTYMEKAITGFVSGKHVFVIAPTGSGKSMCFVSLPLVFDRLGPSLRKSIVIVISLLTAFMRDQVSKYGCRLRSAFIGDQDWDNEDREAVLKGDCQLVYASPEALLGVPRWREMLQSPVYHENTVAVIIDEARCICTW